MESGKIKSEVLMDHQSESKFAVLGACFYFSPT